MMMMMMMGCRSSWAWAWVMLMGSCVTGAVFPAPNPQEKGTSYWLEHGQRELHEALSRPVNTKKAKNVILFLGDGMGVTANTAGRILKGQKEGRSGEEGYLVWDRFPNIALAKTYSIDMQVPDSAATGSAFLSGVKANHHTLGVNGNVSPGDCLASLKSENQVNTILKWAQDAGKATGFVTTTQVTHATVGALYAKSASRFWQCDTKIMKAGGDAVKCKDIARQLVEDEPARNMEVVMGGGRQEMGVPQDDDAEKECVRTDERNLVRDWEHSKEAQGNTHSYVTNTRELRQIDPHKTDYIMGLFADLQLHFELDRDTSLDGTPSLEEMVTVALKRLMRDDDGFFLLVEGGRIDHGLHGSQPRRALEDLLAMERAVRAALAMIDTSETLVVVTADHSHVMTINGYPKRGNDIYGLVTNKDVTDNLPYTTLMFTNGHGFNYTWNGKEVVRRNLTWVDTANKDFEPLAAVPTEEGSETHGGEDVAIFAQGPMAHLFHRVHEQTHVAHVMGYASCTGPYALDCHDSFSSPKNVYKHVNQNLHHSGVSCINPNSVVVLFTLILCIALRVGC